MTVGRGLLSLVLILLAPSLAGARLAYYSDYFSFVGQDEQGRVAFALDTNRGQDGREFQAEHFAVLHAEGQGWIGLRGSGPFPNTGQVLEGLTDSEHFRFAGAPESGMEIRSLDNSLSLRVEAVPVLLDRQRGQDRYWMGSASATLTWAGRTLPGRVIYEHIHFEGWNRLTRTCPASGGTSTASTCCCATRPRAPSATSTSTSTEARSWRASPAWWTGSRSRMEGPSGWKARRSTSPGAGWPSGSTAGPDRGRAVGAAQERS
ncbi:MAG: hypothetical protein ACNA8S_16575 [Deferrisomatales bacterium]